MRKLPDNPTGHVVSRSDREEQLFLVPSNPGAKVGSSD